jgi:hypothetical protein
MQKLDDSPLPGQAQPVERLLGVTSVNEVDFQVSNTLAESDAQNDVADAACIRPDTADSQKNLLNPGRQGDSPGPWKSHKKPPSALAGRMARMERQAHILSAAALMSCFWSAIIREYRVAKNVTWDDTSDCMSALQLGHQCKYEAGVIECLRGLLALSGLVCLSRLYTYFKAHEHFEEEALGDPLHTRGLRFALSLSLSLSLYALFSLSFARARALSLSRSHLQALQPHWPRVLRACQRLEKNVSG